MADIIYGFTKANLLALIDKIRSEAHVYEAETVLTKYLEEVYGKDNSSN